MTPTPPISFTEDGLDRVANALTVAVDAGTPHKSLVAMHNAYEAIVYLRRQRKLDKDALERGTRAAVVGIPPRGY